MNGNTITGQNDTTIAMMQLSQKSGTDIAKQLGNTKRLDKISEKAEEFEAIFIAEMMKPMFEGISTEAPFGGGQGEEIFRGMLLQEYGKSLASSGSIGIANAVKQELIRTQAQAAADIQTQEQ